MIYKKIVFLTGTRADYGKIKSIIQKLTKSNKFKIYIFVTGMHLQRKYGLTYKEIYKDFKKTKNLSIFKTSNFIKSQKREIILSRTINLFSKFVDKVKPDLIIVHGDRLEALAGSLVGTFKKYLVAHIEGGEISGTTDEHLRHSITKLCHIHFVANDKAKKLLVQMGEDAKNIYITGSPDLDLMVSKRLPTIEQVKQRYNIKFKEYAIGILHPNPANLENIYKETEIFCNSIIKSKKNYVLIYPNNDPGNEVILKFYLKFKGNKKIKIFRSMRFEYFITLLKNSSFMIGNSSAGIHEAPFFGRVSINLGNRQHLRSNNLLIKNIKFNVKNILKTINNVKNTNKISYEFGHGNSANKINNIVNKKSFWNLNFQKHFIRNNYLKFSK